MNLVFKRRLSKSTKNKSAQMTLPRCVAEAWADFDRLDLVFDGSCIVVVPARNE